MKLEAHSSETDLEENDLSLQASERSIDHSSHGSSSTSSSTFSIGENSTSPQGVASFYKSASYSSFLTGDQDGGQVVESVKIQQINRCLEDCKNGRSRKKKLHLESMDIIYTDIPVQSLADTSLGGSLHKLSLSGNHLQTIPEKLVRCLPSLMHLDLSHCKLTSLPDAWNLPQLRMLNLSHNGLDFLSETILEGLPDLADLNMYWNKVTEIIIPRSSEAFRRLEILDLGYNNIHSLPDDLDRLKSLRTLKLTKNLLTKIPMYVCEMDLKTIDISGNEVTQPPSEVCKGGILSMKDYYRSLREEKQSKHKRSAKQKDKKHEEKKWFGTINNFGKTLTPLKVVPTSEYNKFRKACKSKSITLKMITTFAGKYGPKALCIESKRKDGDYDKPLIQYIYEAKLSVEIIDYLLTAEILGKVKNKLFNDFVSYKNDLRQETRR